VSKHKKRDAKNRKPRTLAIGSEVGKLRNLIDPPEPERAVKASPRSRTAAAHTTRRAMYKGVEKCHWDMPAGYLLDGSRVASLREVIDPEIPTKPLEKLSQHDLAVLVGRRLMDKKRVFSVRMLGVSGIIDKERAIIEVMELSQIGIHLIEVEKRFIRLLIERS
jgi:hypothetical protein